VATGSRAKNRISKAEQALATRQKVVAAASGLFLREGFVTTTMAMIAKEAGVAVQTLYLSFGSKTAILQAAFDEALRGPDPTDLPETDWFAQVLSDPDGAAALRLWCQHSDIVVRAGPLFGVMRAASADPEVGEVLAHNKKLRHDVYRRLLETFAGRSGFNSNLTVEDALGIVYAVYSEDTYLLMVDEHGWSRERWTAWVTETCVGQLFPDAAS
jgi:AcrR family transcriptional regulator